MFIKDVSGNTLVHTLASMALISPNPGPDITDEGQM